MRKLTLKFDGAKEMLTKEQMKKVTGGDYGGSGCCAHTANWTSYQCGYANLGAAQAAADYAATQYGVRTFYCCQSC